MNALMQRARIEYATGEAWCIAAGRVVLVCERDLAPERAAELHRQAAAVDSLDGLRALVDDEPTALIALVDLEHTRGLLRRHGVPASADETPLTDRFGADWSIDEVADGQCISAGGLGALAGITLPFEGGVIRVAAVRVAPRPADAPADDAHVAPVDDASTAPSTGAFGQTLPPVEAAGVRAEAPAESTDPEVADAPVEPVNLVTDTGSPISGLIDSVPGFIKPAADVRAVDAAPQHEPEAQPAATTAPTTRPVAQEETAPPRPSEAAPAAAPDASAAAGFGDHDGMTITAERARELQAERAQRETATPPATGPLVLSTLCPDGHVNAPGTPQCSQCGATIDDGSAAQRRRPEVAVAVLTSGERVPLGRGVIIGRRPRSRRVEDGRVPRLVTVESPGEDISRSHLELRVEDWNLVAIDLSSTNGTLLLREGAPPQRLRPEASTILQLGDRLDLGDAQVVTIEPAP